MSNRTTSPLPLPLPPEITCKRLRHAVSNIVCTLSTLFRTRNMGIPKRLQLANGISRRSLSVKKIMHGLLILKILHERKYLMRTLKKRPHVQDRKHWTSRMLLKNNLEDMKNQGVVIITHQASLDICWCLT